MSSIAVVTKSYADRGELDTPHGREVVSILVFQDLCIVPLILLLPLLGRGDGATHERRGALACQLGDQLSDEFGVLGVEVLATERVGELEELLDVMPERRGDPERFVFVHLGHEDALRGAVPTEHLVVIMYSGDY